MVEKDPNAEKTEAKKKALNEKKIQLMKDIEQLEYTIELLEKERIFLSKFGERLGPNDKVNENCHDASIALDYVQYHQKRGRWGQRSRARKIFIKTVFLVLGTYWGLVL